MFSILALVFLLSGEGSPESPWAEVRLTIFRDPYVSSDRVTMCRVRADNLGSRSWSGRRLVFEARGGVGEEAVRERGRFGLVLEPHGSLETVIALPGRHDRLEVVPVASGGAGGGGEHRPRKKASGHKSRHAGSRHKRPKS